MLNIARTDICQKSDRSSIDTKRDQLKAAPQKSDRQHAKELGVSHVTVAKVRDELESGGQIDQCSRQASDGRVFHKPVVSVFNPTKREERAMKKPEVVSRMQEDGTSPLVASMKVRCITEA